MPLAEGQKMWVAYLGEIRAVTVVEKGVRVMKFKRGKKPRDAYIVYDVLDEEEFVMSSDDLHHNPRDAHIAAAELAKEHNVQLVKNPTELPVEEEEDADDEEPEEPEEDEEDNEDDEDEDEYEQYEE